MLCTTFRFRSCSTFLVDFVSLLSLTENSKIRLNLAKPVEDPAGAGYPANQEIRPDYLANRISGTSLRSYNKRFSHARTKDVRRGQRSSGRELTLNRLLNSCYRPQSEICSIRFLVVMLEPHKYGQVWNA